MLASRLFFPTLREVPAEAELISHRLLLRGAFMRKVSAGAYALLPLGLRLLKKIESVVREEMDAIGAQELLMPSDREENSQLVQKSTTGLITREIRSYRDLPLTIYHINAKLHREPRFRGGMLKSREYIVLESLSFDQNEDDCARSYAKARVAIARILARMELQFRITISEADANGVPIGEKFFVLAESGEDIVLFCQGCGYAATNECCGVGQTDVESDSQSHLPLNKVETPGCRTVEEVTEFLGTSANRLVKTLLYVADGEPVAALIRGDRELSESKLAAKIGASSLQMADGDLVEKLTGAEVGYAGPVGLKGVRMIADHEVRTMANFVTGANKTDSHYINVNCPRDFQVDEWADLHVAVDKDPCPKCGAALSAVSAIELAHITKLGAVDEANFSDENGRETPMALGRRSLGLTRCLATIAETGNDENGLIWPVTMAPFEAVILLLNPDDEKQLHAALGVYEELREAGVDVLLDERDERSGVKFKDADLLGIPIQVIAGRLASEGKVEIRPRGAEDRMECILEEAAAKVIQMIEREKRALDESADESARIAWNLVRIHNES